MSMSRSNREKPPRGSLHPRNPHQGRYDFAELCAAAPELADHVRASPSGDPTIDFAAPDAVLSLNRAILAANYRIRHWMIPEGYLCPPIPGRADYIHYAADLLAGDGEIPTGRSVRVLDVGTGASCIYPILGSQSYGWSFVASEIDPVSVRVARLIAESNPQLAKLVKIVQQREHGSVFRSVIRKTDRFDLTICNPPFHASMEAAQASSLRKQANLGVATARDVPATLNFGGQPGELWCPGGEVGFLKRMIRESVEFGSQVGWFTSLVAKKEHLRLLEEELARWSPLQVVVIPMSQGVKISRILAWRFG